MAADYRACTTRLAVLLQRLTRGVLARKRSRWSQLEAVLRLERARAGRTLYAATMEQEKKRQVLHCSRLPSVSVMLELQRIFLFYTSAQGRYELEGGHGHNKAALVVDQTRFVKFCNAVPGLLTRDYAARNVERLFAETAAATAKQPAADGAAGSSHSGSSSKGLSYPGFLQALQALADIRLAKVESYGRLVGADARFTKLLIETVLVAPASKRILDRLHKDQHYAAR